MNRKFLWIPLVLMLSLVVRAVNAQDSAYHDLTHYSAVFGHDKFYRLYLPKGYEHSTRRYPVIYFFHGWGGRHFMDVNAKLEYTKLKQLVDKYQVILVMWDGNIDLAEPRPYNVGEHEDVKFQVQMKDYFPELVGHIDSTYRTLAERKNRAIIGFSMGGFMSLFLSGKYPDKVCAAVSFAGSPEFFVGYPDNQELYPVRYTFQNLRDVDLQIHNGNSDILYYLNSEVHAGALWDEKVNLQYRVFPGGHMIDKPGETLVFEKAVSFITASFAKHANDRADAIPAQWSHYDLYPAFDLWGYKVESDKNEPGFIYLKNVDKKGFGLYTQRWLPDGPALDVVQAKITTAPVYTPGRNYGLATYSKTSDQVTLGSVTADEGGRVTVKMDGGGGETGVFTPEETPELVALDYRVGADCGAAAKGQTGRQGSIGTDNRGATEGQEGRYLYTDRENRLTVRLFNRGGENTLPADIRVEISTKDPSVRWKDSVVVLKAAAGQRIVSLPVFTLTCTKTPPPHAEPADIRFHLRVRAPWGVYTDEFTAPVFFRAPLFDSLKVDDGRVIIDTAMGRGNGDGVADAGERIMLYQGVHRLRVFTEDPWVLGADEKLTDKMIPARWPDGFTLSSVIQISPDCPDGHTIELLGHYETKAFNPIERKFTWGRIKLTVRHRAGSALRISMDDFFGVNAGNCEAAPADLATTATWIRDYSAWKWLEPAKDSFTFTDALGKMNYDAYYRQLDSLHVHSLFVVQQAPSWISSNPTASDAQSYAPSGKESGLKPEHYKEAASFYYQLAARYGSRTIPADSLLTKDRLTGLRLMNAIEVCNEPDGNWGNHMSLQQYAALLNAAYDGNGGKIKGAYGVKAADPHMLVSIGGLADNLGSLKKIVAYAGRAPFDIINAHYYTFQNVRESYRVYVPPEWSSLVPDMKDMVDWGRIHAPGRPVWLTEIGWDTKPHSSENVTEQEAGNYLIRSYLLALGTGIEKCFWFIWNDLDDGAEKPGVFASSGFFENASTPWTGPTKLKPKLTYWYDATFKHLLSGYYYDKNLSFPGGDSTIYHYRFTSADGKKQLSVLWYCPKFQFYFRPLSGKPSHINYLYTLPGKEWTIRNVVRPAAGSFEGSAQEYGKDKGGDKETISVMLDGTPVFIETTKE